MHLEDDHHVRIMCSEGLETAYALRWIEEIMALKRQELEKISQATPSAVEPT
jgi:hypothetical protein